MRSATVTALLAGSVLVCGAATGSPRTPDEHPAAAAFSYWGGPFDHVSASSVDWGDFDGDDDLDLLLTGWVGGGGVAWIYRNDGDLSFTRLPDMFPHVANSSVKWGDSDGDGDLDILLTGNTTLYWVSKLYRNDGSGMFVDTGAPLPGVAASSVDWGDQDNDGDLDMILSGVLDQNTGRIARVYRNNSDGTFTNVTSLASVGISSTSWGDYDGDGDQDLILTGYLDAGGGESSKVYRNDGGGVFTDIAAPLALVGNGMSAWGDCDGDGDLDLLHTGLSASGMVAKVYRNDGGAFVDLAAPLLAVGVSSATWADADNDGDLNIHLEGTVVAYQNPASKLYLNDGLGSFTDSGVFLEPVWWGQAAWADADNDGDLDLLETGARVGDIPFTALYLNDAGTPNSLPNGPANLSATVGAWSNGAFQVTFSWDAGSDAETATPGLTYNLRVGHTPASNDVMPSMSSTGGYRRVVRRGNVDHNLSWTLHLPPGTYSWSVQAIDAAYAGSTFASKQTVVVAPVSVPDETQHSTVALRAIEPNPFSAAATIEFEVAREAPVTLRVHDVGGRLVRTLIDGASWSAGRHNATWDGMDENGRPTPAGIYLCTIDIGGVRDQRRVARLR